MTAAAFQSSVFVNAGGGVPGEFYSDVPHRTQSFIIDSSNAGNNIIGSTCCTIVSQGIAEAGGTGIFAGFLVDPKDVALFGSGGQPLNPTLVVPNETQVECLTEGSIWVTLPGAANIGDIVMFDQTTGQISTQAPNLALPGGKSYAFAVVDYFTVTGAGLGVITVTPQQNPYVHQ
jgi:hypothetical protein